MGDTHSLPVDGARLAEVEIKDAQIIFSAVWKDLQAEFGI